MLDSTGRDFASTYINTGKTVYILFLHQLDEVNKKGIASKELQLLIADCKAKNIDFVAVTNSNDQQIKDFIKQNKINFPIYHNPIDPIKGPFMVRDAVRSNPGLVLIKNGVVIDKWAWRNFPKSVSN